MKLSHPLFTPQGLAFPEIDLTKQWFHMLLDLESFHMLTHCAHGTEIDVRESTFSLFLSFCGTSQCNWTGHQETWNPYSFYQLGSHCCPSFLALLWKEMKPLNSDHTSLLTPTGFIDLKVWKNISELPREMWFIQDVILMAKFVMLRMGCCQKSTDLEKCK